MSSKFTKVGKPDSTYIDLLPLHKKPAASFGNKIPRVFDLISLLIPL